jgi:3-deoxy-D-manno-octulosonic-acid transferase
MLVVYSSLLLAALVVGAPYWLVRMAASGRYRAGLTGRLGRVPAELKAVVARRNVVWLHAVSVGEVMAATRLVRELDAALGGGWVVVVSTTTPTGQALARERFGAERVFFYPLDLGWAVKAYVKALRPKLLVLMESELWPEMLAACGRAAVPVAVVNARVSDRSFARGLRVRAVWGGVLRQVGLFAAQSEEDARRLLTMGAREQSVLVTGNLKYDVRVSERNRAADLVREVAAGRPVIVAGSTVGRGKGDTLSEDEMVIRAWNGSVRQETGALLVLAPRHPERFAEVERVAREFRLGKISEFSAVNKDRSLSCTGGGEEGNPPGISGQVPGTTWSGEMVEILLLDTIGDLGAVYGVADVAFVGGSLVRKGGHNPLEPAQSGVPVVMGASYENFREVVAGMQAADGIRVVKDVAELTVALMELLQDRAMAGAMGERGRQAFEVQAGATARTVRMLTALLQETTTPQERAVKP